MTLRETYVQQKEVFKLSGTPQGIWRRPWPSHTQYDTQPAQSSGVQPWAKWRSAFMHPGAWGPVESLTVSISLQCGLRGSPLIHLSRPYYYDVALFNKDCLNEKDL